MAAKFRHPRRHRNEKSFLLLPDAHPAAPYEEWRANRHLFSPLVECIQKEAEAERFSPGRLNFDER